MQQIHKNAVTIQYNAHLPKVCKMKKCLRYNVQSYLCRMMDLSSSYKLFCNEQSNREELKFNKIVKYFQGWTENMKNKLT